MAVGDIVHADWTITRATKAIRYVGADHDAGSGTPSYSTVIKFHRWLQDLADDAIAVPANNDQLDITNTNPSTRSTDNIITLINGYNIDDNAAEHLYDGSIIQNNTDDIYDGIVNFGNPEVQIQIIQNGKILADDWWNYNGTTNVYGTGGLNADSTSGISHRFMIKTKSGGTVIDSGKLIGTCRRITISSGGKTFSEFTINSTSRGNNVLALSDGSDLNNSSTLATIAGWTGITNLTEGYKLMDIDDEGTDEEYYSEWTRSSYTINQFYERMKWLTYNRATGQDSNTADTGTSYAVGNATIDGQAQTFANGTTAQFLTKVQVRMKKTGSPTGNLTAKLYAMTGTFNVDSKPTGAALATSDTFNVANLSSTYTVKTLGFSTQYLMNASTNYAIAIEYTGGDGSNYVQVEGKAAGTHQGNQSSLSSATWTPTAGADLWFIAYAAPSLYGINGQLFRGITHEIALSGTSSGTFSAYNAITWNSNAGGGQMFAIDNVTASSATKMWIQHLWGSAPTGLITKVGGGATATVSSVTARDLSKPFVGVSTGSALIGSYGLGVKYLDLTSNDLIMSLNGIPLSPPNIVTVTIKGLTQYDRVLLAPWDGTTTDTNGDPAIDKGQFHLSTALTIHPASPFSVVVKAGTEGPTIPADTPATGWIRVTDNNGFERRLHYSSWTGSTFTVDTDDGSSEDFSSVNASVDNHVYIAYMDNEASLVNGPGLEELSFSAVQTGTRDMVVLVRRGIAASAIKQYIAPFTQSSTPAQSITPIKTTDL